MLETALAYESVFQTPTKDLFAGLYRKVERRTREKARILAGKLGVAKPDRFTARKLAMLQVLLASNATT